MKRDRIQILLIIAILSLCVFGCATFYAAGMGAVVDLSQPENIDYSLAALEHERPENELIITLDDDRFFECKLIDIRFKNSTLFNEELQVFIDNYSDIGDLPKQGDSIEVTSIEEIKTNWELIALEKNYIRVRRDSGSVGTVIFYKHFYKLAFENNSLYKNDLLNITKLPDFPAYTFVDINVNSDSISLEANRIVRIQRDNKSDTGKLAGIIFGLTVDLFFGYLALRSLRIQ